MLSNNNYSFNKELCMAMLSANIPFNKFKNKLFRNFLEKHIAKKIPDESTLRKNYVDECVLTLFSTGRQIKLVP